MILEVKMLIRLTGQMTSQNSCKKRNPIVTKQALYIKGSRY